MSNTLTYVPEADMQNLLERLIESYRNNDLGSTSEKNSIATQVFQQSSKLCLEAGCNGVKS